MEFSLLKVHCFIEIPNKKTIALNRFEIWILKFIWKLVLGICYLRHQTPKQSRRTLTWPKRPDFSRQNKNAVDFSSVDSIENDLKQLPKIIVKLCCLFITQIVQYTLRKYLFYVNWS